MISLATVVISGAVDIDTDTAGTAINFLQQLTDAKNLTLSSGGGAVDINGIIGSTTAIGTLTVNQRYWNNCYRANWRWRSSQWITWSNFNW